MKPKEHPSLHDRQIAAIRSLLREGTRLMVETRRELRVIATLTRRNEEALKQIID